MPTKKKVAVAIVIAGVVVAAVVVVLVLRPWEKAAPTVAKTPSTVPPPPPPTVTPPPTVIVPPTVTPPPTVTVPPPIAVAPTVGGRYVRIQRVNLRSVPVDVGAVLVYSPANARLLPIAADARPALDPASTATAWRDFSDTASGGMATTEATSASLTLDLGAVVSIGLVRVVPRKCATAAKCEDRLGGCQVQILEATGRIVWAADLLPVGGGYAQEFAVAPPVAVVPAVRGYSVRIKRVTTIRDWLDVGALLVYGPAGERLTPTAGRLWPPNPSPQVAAAWANMADDDPVNSSSTDNNAMCLAQVDFGATVAIDSIRLLARVCGSPYDLVCRDRMRDCQVHILDEAGWPVWSADLRVPPTMAQTFTVRALPVGRPVRARYVRVQRKDGRAIPLDVGAMAAYDAANTRLTPTGGAVVPLLGPTVNWSNLSKPDLLVPAVAGPSVDGYVQLDYGALVTVAFVRVMANHDWGGFQEALDRLVGCQLQLLDSSSAVVWSADMPTVPRTDNLFTVGTA